MAPDFHVGKNHKSLQLATYAIPRKLDDVPVVVPKDSHWSHKFKKKHTGFSAKRWA
jgi:hypothetical protein